MIEYSSQNIYHVVPKVNTTDNDQYPFECINISTSPYTFQSAVFIKIDYAKKTTTVVQLQEIIMGSHHG